MQRQPAVRDRRRQLDVPGPERRHVHRDAFADRMIDQLQRLAESGPEPLGQRDLVIGASVLKPVAPPDRPADLDDLGRPGERRVIGDAVEALDHLRPGSAEAEDEPAA
jgi:hypothetical protein